MTKVITPTAARQKSHGAKAIAVPSAGVAETAFGDIASALFAAAQTDDDQYSGDSNRLLRIAGNLADAASIKGPVGHSAETDAYDIAALVKSALMVPGDNSSPERLALIEEARPHLVSITGCKTVLEAELPAHIARTIPPSLHPLGGHAPDTGTDIRARMKALHAAMAQADTLLERAYDAAESGSGLETLLELTGHTLVADALRPMKNELPTKEDAAATYNAMFHALAVLQGAIVLAQNTVLHGTLNEALELLNWTHGECESTSLPTLLPEASNPSATGSGQRPSESHWPALDEQTTNLQSASILLDMLMTQTMFQYEDPQASANAQERIAVLAHAIEPRLAESIEEIGRVRDALMKR